MGLIQHWVRSQRRCWPERMFKLRWRDDGRRAGLMMITVTWDDDDWYDGNWPHNQCQWGIVSIKTVVSDEMVWLLCTHQSSGGLTTNMYPLAVAITAISSFGNGCHLLLLPHKPCYPNCYGSQGLQFKDDIHHTVAWACNTRMTLIVQQPGLAF